MSGNMGAGGFGAGGFGHGDSNQSAFRQDDDIIDGEYQDKTASSNQSTAADTSLEDKR